MKVLNSGIGDKNALIFIGGAVTGSLVSWYFTKKKYETLAENEIAKMREGYRKKNKELADRARVKPNISEVVNDRITIHQEDVDLDEKEENLIAKYAEESEPTGEENISPNDDIIEFIDDSEFASMNGYEKVNLVLYEDDVLANEMSDDIVLVEDTVGQQAIDDFKHYNPEAFYVRNNQLMTEYEITRDHRTYEEVTGIPIREYDS